MEKLSLRLTRDEQSCINGTIPPMILKAIGGSYAEDILKLLSSAFLAKTQSERESFNRNIVELPMPRCENYTDTFSFKQDYLAWNLLRKNASLRTGINTHEVALQKMELSESVCAVTNRKWRDLMAFKPSDLHLVSQVQRKILSIIDSDFTPEELWEGSSWGPGATLEIKSRNASSFLKYRDEHGITPDAFNFIRHHFDEVYPHLKGRIFCLEPGDRVITVRKDATTDRVIKIQPGWNIFFQKGLGKILRLRLKRYGLDLDHQAVKDNQDRARRGSTNGFWATTDLTSASDRLAIEPLRHVLPDAWFQALDLFRCKSSLDGRRWNGFSAMGNGFTFELESLLFYAISTVICENHGYDRRFASVFGDDIVTPASLQTSLQEALSLFGFEVNTKKTFSAGDFRESCGSHYVKGIDCKPYYIKDSFRSVEDLYKAHNSVIRLSRRVSYRDARYLDAARAIKRSVPKALRHKTPVDFGDIGFHSNFEEALPIVTSEKGYALYHFTAIHLRPIKWETEEPELLLVRLTEHSDLPRHNSVDVKQRTIAILKKRYVTPEWEDMGPWL